MATVTVLDEKTLKIAAGVEDAIALIHIAEQHIEQYAGEIVTIFEKMPEFGFVYFCFYAYDSARLFEQMLGDVDPKQYLSFSLDAPDAFFYTLYGGMAALQERAKAARRLAAME
ncbi:hypothetical protein SD70_06070 [Gordoniibacillus kamchatkensis]|uniref:Uncharacterized protein n=1 Tax=Gordoniibacillus kamchatkensis TaxID=1590651 RepID=A0ABR5ALH8_9BACL|nr:hypothetical protein [Paenibacillus sp. VKM B-2647]KIL41673.1 hypothetical protein SD70_06070 [Paenibacillus sp. VKM B-2647]